MINRLIKSRGNKKRRRRSEKKKKNISCSRLEAINYGWIWRGIIIIDAITITFWVVSVIVWDLARFFTIYLHNIVEVITGRHNDIYNIQHRVMSLRRDYSRHDIYSRCWCINSLMASPRRYPESSMTGRSPSTIITLYMYIHLSLNIKKRRKRREKRKERCSKGHIPTIRSWYRLENLQVKKYNEKKKIYK